MTAHAVFWPPTQTWANHLQTPSIRTIIHLSKIEQHSQPSSELLTNMTPRNALHNLLTTLAKAPIFIHGGSCSPKSILIYFLMHWPTHTHVHLRYIYTHACTIVTMPLLLSYETICYRLLISSFFSLISSHIMSSNGNES